MLSRDSVIEKGMGMHCSRENGDLNRLRPCDWLTFHCCVFVQAGMLLSEYFYDTERLEPEIQDKLQAVLKDWQGVFLDGKGTNALSVRRK